MIINEQELIGILDQSNHPLLIEPKYNRKYLPLGLAKISSYFKKQNKSIIFSRKVIAEKEIDLVCITSLFTYDSAKVNECIEKALYLYPKHNIILGGIYASLMHKQLEKKYPNIKIFNGYSKILDQYIPDYETDWDIDDKWKDYSLTFTTRGCPNKCAYCAVWRIEPNIWVNPTWKESVNVDKKIAMISDNNLSNFPEHLKDVVNHIKEVKKKAMFDNGFDCKLINPDIAKLLGSIKYAKMGMRLAFDRIEEDGVFQDAINLLISNGVAKSNIMAYCLFNFNDTPLEANYRMEECKRLGIRPYPTQYQPLNRLSRNDVFVAKHWTLNLLRKFRYFWLMAGLYTKGTFEDYINVNDKITLTDIDKDKYFYKK